jgi:predicted ATPase/class 3 adenylate cyclase
MAFEQVVDAAIDLLRRRQRVTYRMLQREFALDDAALSDLANELIRGQRLARDEDGEVLVWHGATVVAPAERRQLTVMFCDLVGSTRLSHALDPEDLREVMHLYQTECEAVLGPLGGHIAQYLGDGILAYFGYPAAHEDDAERAVRAGLGIVQTVRRLCGAVRARFGIELSVRVGIHTGLVVIGDIGAADRRETLALGEAPNLAAHIQAGAEPNTVMVSEDTLRLLFGRFITEDRGHAPHKVGRPLRVARIVGERDPGERRSGRSLLLDRQGHWVRLQQAWNQACEGQPGAVMLRGDAGMGKTRLVDELRAAVRAVSGELIVLRCSAFHRHSALHPFAEQIGRRAGLEADSPSDDVSDRLRALLAVAELEQHPSPVEPLALLAALVAPGSAPAAAAAALAPAELMQATQGLLLAWLAAAARRAPLLLVFEDLHWADASTLALLKQQLLRPVTPRALTVLTARPDFEAPWAEGATTTVLHLDRMPADALAELVCQVAGTRALPRTLIERIVDAADGVPLYGEEITKAVLESAAGREPSAMIDVPPTLQASLLARLDRLGSIKPLAQTAALLGREFSFELLAAVADTPMAELGPALHQLVGADLLRRRGTPPQARYSFRHALLQSAAADSLLRSTRMQLHRRIAEALQMRFPATVEAEPETLAHHLTEAGESLRAIPLWQRAGDRALARSALVEAIAHLEAGLSLLKAAGDGPGRDRIELQLQLRRASALRAVAGVAAPATGQAYERTVALAYRLDDTPQLIPALNGLYSYHMVRGQCDAAADPAQALLRVARECGDAMYQMIGHRAVGAVAFHLGEPVTAREHLQQAIALYDRERHAQLAVTLGIDHKVIASNFLSLTLFVLGERGAALACQRENLAHAETLDHAHSRAQALVFGCVLLALCDEWQELPEWAERVVLLGQQHGFPLMEGGGRFFLGAARAFGGTQPGDLEAGLAAMEHGAQLWWSTGARNYRAYVELLMAQAQARLGRMPAARAILQAANAGMAATGERWIEPELLRVEGELLHEPGRDPAAGDALLQRALACARRQHASGWERRVLASLAEREAQPLRQAAEPTMP